MPGAIAICPDRSSRLPDARTIDGRSLSAVPGFVDAHTHAVFAGDRRHELRRRLAGASYAEIAAEGGGIVSTVRATREATEHELVAATHVRLAEMLACGTTTAEVKSGYGLDVESEMKQLRAIRQLAVHAADRPGADVHGRARDPARLPVAARGLRAPGHRRDDPARGG